MDYKIQITDLIYGCHISLIKNNTYLWTYYFSYPNNFYYIDNFYYISNQLGEYFNLKGGNIKKIEAENKKIFENERNNLLKMIFFVINPKKKVYS